MTEYYPLGEPNNLGMGAIAYLSRSTCMLIFEDIKACGVCKNTRYCSRDCQKLDWPKHKLVCSKSNKLRKSDGQTYKAGSSDTPIRQEFRRRYQHITELHV